MSLLSTKDLVALGLAPSMLGEAEHLALPEPSVDLARGLSRGEAAADDLLDARSDVLQALGIALRLDLDDRILQFEWSEAMAVRVRDAHPSARPYPAADPGTLRLPLRQLGRFLVESPAGVPLALGVVEPATLTLVPVGAWPAPSLEDWILPMIDTWLQSTVERTLPAADTWTRVTLAGMITRLAEPSASSPADVRAAGDATGSDAATDVAALLARLSHSPAMRPRMWARSLDPASLAAIEEHARRRAVALEDDLEDLLAVMPLDDEDAAETWTRLCHRRDDIEGVRVLLLEAGSGAGLDDALGSTDRAGRAMRVNLGSDVATDDERLRRVALGDPGAWWGELRYEVRLL